ncbi:MAG: N-acetylmuramoyl-L-alanine amidase, partial [Bacteroidia bacterium]
MKKLLLFSSLFLFLKVSNADEIVVNKFAASFNKAYLAHPEIPRGILEAVAFCNTRFTNIQHASAKSESCAGVPNAYGVMGLTLDGEGYFSDNLKTVADLSHYSISQIMNDPEINILAYADAYANVRKILNTKDSRMEDHLSILSYLSELPKATQGQLYAFAAQEYGYLQFLNNVDYQQRYGFPNYHIDFEKIFGAEDYAILSSTTVTVTDESITNKSGQTFHYRSPTSTDFGPAIWNAAASCNYSVGRGGTAISAVTIHDVEGTYAGCISWFQNCAASVSAHYVARSSDGQITQMVLEANKAWHVGSENGYTIGIEHEGYVSTASWYTTAMYIGSAALVRDICTSGYGINPLRTYYGPGCSGSSSTCGIGACTTIKGHQMFPMQTHDDPGPNWNWAYYYLLINNSPTITTVTTPTGTFYDSGGPSGSYSSDERKLTLIQPAGATSISLNFTSFNTELNWDYLF